MLGPVLSLLALGYDHTTQKSSASLSRTWRAAGLKQGPLKYYEHGYETHADSSKHAHNWPSVMCNAWYAGASELVDSVLGRLGGAHTCS